MPESGQWREGRLRGMAQALVGGGMQGKGHGPENPGQLKPWHPTVHSPLGAAKQPKALQIHAGQQARVCPQERG